MSTVSSNTAKTGGKAFFSFLKGQRCQRKGQICTAIKHYSKAVNLDHELFQAFNIRGLAYKSLENYELAIEDYNIVEQLHPNAKLFHNRGCAYSALGTYEQAVQDFDKSLVLNIDRKDKSLTFGNRGWALLHLFDWGKAKTDLGRAQQMGWDIKPLFYDYYTSVADFEQKNNVRMPQGIAAMLSE